METGQLAEAEAVLQTQYGDNKRITDGNYDKHLAVKCVSGTFVGKKAGNVIEYRGIPFVGEQPVGEYRWKAPVAYVADDGVYEAYYDAKSPRQLNAALTEQGEDCLYLNIWKASEAGAEKKPVMVWIHGSAFAIGGVAEPWV